MQYPGRVSRRLHAGQCAIVLPTLSNSCLYLFANNHLNSYTNNSMCVRVRLFTLVSQSRVVQPVHESGYRHLCPVSQHPLYSVGPDNTVLRSSGDLLNISVSARHSHRPKALTHILIQKCFQQNTEPKLSKFNL